MAITGILEHFRDPAVIAKANREYGMNVDGSELTDESDENEQVPFRHCVLHFPRR